MPDKADESGVDRPEESAERHDDRWFERHERQPFVRVPDLGTRGDAILHALVVLLAALAAQILFVAVGLGLLDSLGITQGANPAAFFAAQSALGLSGFLAVGFAYLYWRGDPGLVGIRRPTRGDVRLTLGGFILLAGLMFGLEFLFELLDVELAENVVVEQGREHPELLLVLVPIQFLFTGPGEELLFRGVVQGVLREAYGVVPAIGFASALFALFHLPALVGGNPVPVLVVLFLSGVVLGALYEYSRTLLVPVLVHAMWNALVFGSEYVAAVGFLLG